MVVLQVALIVRCILFFCIFFSYFQFYDGELLSSAYVTRYCGKMVPPTLLTQTNILYTLFRSTTDFDERNGIGFTMTYRHVNGM